jgi:hypothetical protein
MLNLNERGLEILMKRSKSSSIDMFWNNYDFIIWEKNSKGIYNKNGMFRNDSWGMSRRIVVSSDGIWVLPIKYVKHFR